MPDAPFDYKAEASIIASFSNIASIRFTSRYAGTITCNVWMLYKLGL